MDDQPSAAAVDHAIRRYRKLLIDFVSLSLSAEAFEVEYRARYLDSADDYNASVVFDRVDAFFADADAFVADPELRDTADGDLDADQLREQARQLLSSAGHRVAVPAANAPR